MVDDLVHDVEVYIVIRQPVYSLSLQDIMDLKSVLSQIPSHLQVNITLSEPSEVIDYCHSVYLTHRLSVASPGSGPVALAVVACILALLSLPLILVLVYKQRQNTHSSRRMYYDEHKQAHQRTFPCPRYESDINLIRVPRGALSATYFLSESWINCVSHSRKHVHTLSVVFGSVSIHSQWPISHFLSPRCTGAGEDGQVSFPTDCRAAVRIHQLLFRIITLYTCGILQCRGHHIFLIFLHNR